MIIIGPVQTKTISAETISGLDIGVNKYLGEVNLRAEDLVDIKYWYDPKEDKLCATISFSANKRL